MNRNFSAKKLCTLGLLTAITVILAMFCTFRIGELIKIPFKFISVFLTAAIFGPLWGGTVAVIGDILNVFFTGMAFNPLISIVEFLCGLVFGILFYNRPFCGKGYILRTALCSIIMFFIDMVITSYILTVSGIFASFEIAVYSRFIAGIIKALLHFVFIAISVKFLPQFKKLTEN